MNSHISSKMLLRRIAGKNQKKGKEKIGYYDIKNQKYGTMKIDSKNKEITIENLHDKINPFCLRENFNLEFERSKLENNFAKILDQLIYLEVNKQIVLTEEQYDLFLKFYIFQSFTTLNNFKNNENLIQKEIFEIYRNISKYEKIKYSEFMRKMKVFFSEDQGIESVNEKLIDLIQNQGSYFDKMQILKHYFTPVILNLNQNKAFYTDKLFRIYGLSGKELIEAKILPQRLKLTKSSLEIENIGFSLIFLQIGPIDNNNLLVFLNNDYLNAWNLTILDIADEVTGIKKIRNQELENDLFSLIGDISVMNQIPTQYIWFNNEDIDWIKEYFSRAEYLDWYHKKSFPEKS